MAGPQQNLNTEKPEATLSYMMDILRRDIFLSLRCHDIGTIQKFNTAHQTAEVSINYKRTEFNKKADGSQQQVTKDYPLLLDVPVVCLFGGSFSMRFPIKPGDTCVLLYNDRSIDAWFDSGQVASTGSSRAHSLSDAMALVGLNSLKSSLPNYDADKFQITDGNATFELSSESAKAQFGNSLLELKTKIKLANNSKNLKAVLDEIVDVISNLQVVVSGGSSAGSWPVSPATTSAAAAAKTSIGGLLE
jgi:hypothetical protein